MNFKKIVWIIFLMSLTLSGRIFAQSDHPSEQSLPELDLAILIDKAVENNPEIAGAKAEWLAAKKDVWIQSSLPDPLVRIAPGTMESEYEVSQAIPFPGKLLEKGKMAQENSRAAKQRYEALKRDITSRLAAAYVQLYYVDASTEVLMDMKELLSGIERVAESRYSSLSGTSRDVAKAQAEVSMIFERLYRLDAERETVTAMINVLLDQDPMTALGKAAALPVPQVEKPLMEMVNLAVLNRQEIKESEAVAQKSAHARRLAGLAYIPDVQVGGKYTRRDNGENGWMIPISFSIPLWQNRIIPEIKQADQLYEASQARIRAARNQTFFEVKDAYHRYEAARKIHALYESAVIPQAEIALNADRSGYESGGADFLNLLDSERVYLNAKLSAIQFFTDMIKAYIDLNRATGLSFDAREGYLKEGSQEKSDDQTK